MSSLKPVDLLARLRALLVIALAVAMSSCSESPDPVGPSPSAELSASVATQVSDLESQIDDLFPGRGLRNAARRQLRNIARDVDRGNLEGAEEKLFGFLEFAFAHLENDRLLDPAGSAPPTTNEAFFMLTGGLFDLVGLEAPTLDPAALGPDGAAEIVDEDGGLIVTETLTAGVDIPPGTFAGPTLVTIARLPDPVVPGTGPLPTTLDQFPLFYDFSASSPLLQQVTVGICVEENPPNPLGAPTSIFPFLQLAHPDPQNPQTVEILAVAAAPFLTCPDGGGGAVPNVTPSSGGLSSVLGGLGKALWTPVAEAFGARELHASGSSSAARAHRGLGGLTSSFSPFGAVNPNSSSITWSTVPNPSGGNLLTGVWGIDESTFWVVGLNGVVLRTDDGGTTWVDQAPAAFANDDFFGIWTPDGVNVWLAMGDDVLGLPILYSPDGGASWIVQHDLGNIGPGLPTLGVWGFTTTDVWVSASASAVLHFDGQTWSSSQPAGLITLFVDVWGPDPQNIFVAATGQGIAESQDGGATWTGGPLLNTSFEGIWGSGRTDVYAVGSESGAAGMIAHNDGSGWQVDFRPTTQFLWDIEGSGPNDIFAVGSGGAVYHQQGAGWTIQPQVTQSNLQGVWVAPVPAGDVFAVGTGGTIVRGSR